MTRKHRRSWPLLLWPAYAIMLISLLAACGGATTAASNSSGAMSSGRAQNPASSVGKSASLAGSANASGGPQSVGPQYLVKTLTVTMAMSDTRKAANEIQAWITTKDPRAVSAGANYQQVDTNSYSISMTFAVESTLYPQVYAYLRDYNLHNNGHLTNFSESVQDISSDYVDTQSRIKTYKGEQDRLLELLKQAQSMSDVLTIQQKLSDVEQQIEQTEAHLNLLNNQITFYNVTIQIQPVPVVAPVTPPATQSWSIGQTFQTAFAIVVAIGQGLLTMVIWLLAFSVYIIPLGLIIWLVGRWREHRLPWLVARVVQQTPPKSE